MQELVVRITEKAHISPHQAEAAVEAIANFIKEKYPLLKGNIDSLLGLTSNHSERS